MSDLASPMIFRLPLVSVVIVNYNYGQFLADSVGSVFAQSYSNIECIVLDNKSTDDSAARLSELEIRYPSLKIVRREENDGQCVASGEGFFATSGEYVVFLDADDVLLPTFVSTHVYVHLSLRIPVAFSCSDMMQATKDRLVLGAFFAMNAFVRSGRGRRTDLLRPFPNAEGASELTPVDATQVLFCEPHERGWPWSSTSGFLFRRDALAIVLDQPRLEGHQLRTGRLFGPRPERAVWKCCHRSCLDGLIACTDPTSMPGTPSSTAGSNFDRGGTFDQERRAREALIDLMVRRADLHLRKFADSDAFFEALMTINETKPRLKTAGGVSYFGRKLLERLREVRPHVQTFTVVKWLLRAGVSPPLGPAGATLLSVPLRLGGT